MEKLNKKIDLQMEVLTPLHVGAGAEKDWIQGCDFIIDDNRVKVLNLKKVSQFVNNSDLTNALLKKDDKALLMKLGKNLSHCVEKEFDVAFFGSNDIKTFIKNGLTQNPIVPGSSLKGAMRSIVLDYLMTPNDKTTALKVKKLDEKEIFGKANIGDEFFRFIKVSDSEFSETKLANTKIFNLKSQSEGGWKHGSNNTSEKFKPEGFNTFYEVIPQNQKSTLSLSIADIAFENFYKKIKSFSELKNKLIKSDISYFFDVINRHTQEYLKKEKAFFEEYSTDKSDLIVKSINSLLAQIPKNGEYCVLKMAAGSGFHSITGDWQFNDYSIDELTIKEEKFGKTKTISRGVLKGKKSAKSRKIAISGENDFSLMGFVKLTVMDEKMLATIEREKDEKKQIELAKLQKQQEEHRLLQQQIAELEAKNIQYKSLISEAQSLFDNKDYKIALSKIEQAEALALENNSHLELKQQIVEAIDFQNKLDAIELKKQQEEQQRKAQTEAKLSSGLAAYLEEKNLKDEFKVNNFGILKGKIDKYLKDSDQKNVPENEMEVLEKNIKRVYDGLKPSEKRDWNSFDGNKIWKEISNWTTIDFAKTVYDKIII